MLSSRISTLISNKCLLERLVIKTQARLSTSVEPAVKTTQEEYEKQLKSFETLTNISRKVRTKKPQRPPFAKNLLLGIFDKEVLTYPQLEKEDIENLEKSVEPLEKLLKQPHMVNVDSISNKNFRQNLSDYRAIGLQASQFLDGRECNVTESARFLEALANHNLRDSIIYNEQLGVQVLVKFANDKLKTKYLLKLMKGEALSAFCVTEPMLTDVSSMSTKAKLSKDKKTWEISGQKAWVVNRVSADYLIVFALTELIERDVIKEPKFTVFLIEKNSPGIKYTKKTKSGIEICDITFENTPVPAENIIGEYNQGEDILKSFILDLRLSSGPACISLSKNMLNNLAKGIVDQSTKENMLHETDAIRSKIGEICVNLYAMESITYLTTGLLDSYENQDCTLESVLVKVFCAENTYKISTICLDLVGYSATEESHWCYKTHQDCLNYMTLHETNDSLKLTIALMGLQHAGANLNEKIKMLRNPLFHGGYILKRMFTNRRNMEDNPKLDLRLGDYLHPSTHNGSELLEYCVKRLEFATEVLLARHGMEIVNKHIELRRLADCILDIYAMTACLGRASRSYCIGLQHGDSEMLIADAFCVNAMERVKYNVKKIQDGQFLTNDENYRSVAKRLFKFNGYFPKHPLARNF